MMLSVIILLFFAAIRLSETTQVPPPTDTIGARYVQPRGSPCSTSSDELQRTKRQKQQPWNGEAKFWLEPSVKVATNYGLNVARLNDASKLVEEHLDEIRSAWAKHFPG